MENVKINSVYQSTYGNGTYWIEYENDGKIGYELTGEVTPNMTDEEIKEFIIPNQYKADLCNLEAYLKELIEECKASDNEMYYVSHEDLKDMFDGDTRFKEKFLENLYHSALYSNLTDYIDINVYEDFDADAITVYGGVLTKVLF